MNLIGHNYISYRVLGRVSPYTFLGSHIPDFVPFLPSSVFTFDEIHENHEDFLKFVEANYPFAIDLPLSMMCHCAKYGADKYNREIDAWLLKDNENLLNELAQLISQASGISYETALGPRLHNYLWCGVDVFLIKNDPQNIIQKLIDAFERVNYNEAARILSSFYGKDIVVVEENLKTHFEPINEDTFQSIEGFTRFWKVFLSPLKEGDNLDLTEGEDLLNEIYSMFENEWESVIDRVETGVSESMGEFIKDSNYR